MQKKNCIVKWEKQDNRKNNKKFKNFYHKVL